MAVSSNKQVYHFEAKVEEVEIRRIMDDVTQFVNKTTGEVKDFHSVKLFCDVGENLDRVIFKDKNMEHMKYFSVGMVGTIVLRIDVEEEFGASAKFTVYDFLVDNKSIFVDQNEKPRAAVRSADDSNKADKSNK